MAPDSLAGPHGGGGICRSIIAAQYGQVYLVTFCFTVAGALLAFLWFNAHPAEVFMGDTGSLALGATLAIVAMMLGQVLLLIFIGFVFVAEAVSVVLEVVYFKGTGGKRRFHMAPCTTTSRYGWSETQVAQRFWLISMVSGLGVALALV
jgi:phospho-N-acetylmuramoyl-pentapeptide-transferase